MVATNGMSFGRRLGITVVAIVLFSFLGGLLWRLAFDSAMPAYLSGLLGGLAALPIWEFTRSR